MPSFIFYPLFRVLSRKLVQCLILFKKGTSFLKKGNKNFTTPCSVPFLSVLHQNKALYNFRKRGQRSIAERINSLD